MLRFASAVFAVLIALSVVGPASAVAARSCRLVAVKKDDGFKHNEASETLSQIVRDNHLDFVKFEAEYARKIAEKNSEKAAYVEKALTYEGWISGDNHAGNYIVSEMNGKLRYFFTDIKDGGVGPYFFNIANLIMNTHVVAHVGGMKLKPVTKEILKAYLDGLRDEKHKAPETVRQALETDLKKYEQWRDEDAEKFLNSDDKFKLKDGKLEPLGDHVRNVGAITRDVMASIRRLPEHLEVLDIAVRPKERGGSKNLLRIWAAVREPGKKHRIIEFKEINVPAAESYRASGLDLKAHTEKMMRQFWGETDEWQKVTKLDSTYFLMRPRKVELFKVPYRQRMEKDQDELMDLATYAAYYTGLNQGSQRNGPAFLKFVEKDEEAFAKALRSFIKAYYEHLQLKLGEDED